jgi:hypothetical protein
MFAICLIWGNRADRVSCAAFGLLVLATNDSQCHPMRFVTKIAQPALNSIMNGVMSFVQRLKFVVSAEDAGHSLEGDSRIPLECQA